MAAGFYGGFSPGLRKLRIERPATVSRLDLGLAKKWQRKPQI
jgi:hypothetical protein